MGIPALTQFIFWRSIGRVLQIKVSSRYPPAKKRDSIITAAMRHSAEVEWVFVRRPRVAFSFGRADDRLLVASGFHHAAAAQGSESALHFALGRRRRCREGEAYAKNGVALQLPRRDSGKSDAAVRIRTLWPTPSTSPPLPRGRRPRRVLVYVCVSAPLVNVQHVPIRRRAGKGQGGGGKKEVQ